MTWTELSSKSSPGAEYLQRACHLFRGCGWFDLFVVMICLASFFCSYIESMVNNDNLHWGWAYLAALDIKRGAIPHSQIIIFYGYIYTLIQSFSLVLFGERLMSVGIITGLFYSATLFLSYRIFCRFLQKHVAFAAVLLIFLIHPYIIYPMANYFAYTFQLLALLCFLRYAENRYNGLWAGFFLCMSVLSRYSSLIAVLPPFILLLLWDYVTDRGTGKNALRKTAMVSCGFFVPLLIFFAYLLTHSALHDFFYQNKMLVSSMGRVGSFETFLNFLGCIFQIEESLASDLRGKLFTLILIVCLFALIREIVRSRSDVSPQPDCRRYDIIAVCLVAVFGFLNAVHVYETFRLINGASLGVGICALVYCNALKSSPKFLKYSLILLVVLLCLFLTSTLFFSRTSSSYYPWRTDVLLRSGVSNKNIGILKGKMLTKAYNDFYQEVFDAIAPYKNFCYILNYTNDVVALSVNDLPRIQIAPVQFSWLDDISKQGKLVAQHQAVILSYRPLELPGYEKIFKKTWPDEIPWMGGGYLFIYAPVRHSGEKQM